MFRHACLLASALGFAGAAVACSSDDEDSKQASGREPGPTLLGSVQFSVPSQTYEGELEVGLTSSVAADEIHYTTNGAFPTSSSTVYDGTPLRLQDTTELRARSFRAGAPVGEVSTAIYIARTFDATSNLPLVLLDGYGGGQPQNKDVFARVGFMVFEPAGGSAALSKLPTVATRAGYHLRGQSSAQFDKAPYRLELWDNEDADADYPLLGMPAEADWALIGPYVDRSFIRNAFVYSLGRDLGMQAPRFAFVEVYLNHANRPVSEQDYQGLYMVTETIKNQKNRLDLAQLDETVTMTPDITGGYIFKFEYAAAEEPILPCQGGGNTCWNDLEVFDPSPLGREQASYLQGYVQDFHDSLHVTPLGPYEDYIDVASFIDQMIINELVRDMDAYIRSAYFYKDRNQKIVAGPLWDYNLSSGVGGFFENQEFQGWQFAQRAGTVDWFVRLADDPAFWSRVVARWRELRSGLLSETQINARITTLAQPLAEAAARDFERWPANEIRRDISFFDFPDASTWEGQVQAMRDWLPGRIAWLDSQWQ